jgi:hypothetical protein
LPAPRALLLPATLLLPRNRLLLRTLRRLVLSRLLVRLLLLDLLGPLLLGLLVALSLLLLLDLLGPLLLSLLCLLLLRLLLHRWVILSLLSPILRLRRLFLRALLRGRPGLLFMARVLVSLPLLIFRLFNLRVRRHDRSKKQKQSSRFRESKELHHIRLHEGHCPDRTLMTTAPAVDVEVASLEIPSVQSRS